MAPQIFTHQQWDALLEETFTTLRQLAKAKGGEYSGDFDRLANFRRNAEDCGLDYRQIWRVYAGKHWDALSTYIKDLSTGTSRERMEPIEGRVDDLLVYLLLFKAMLQEQEPQPAQAPVVAAAPQKFRQRLREADVVDIEALACLDDEGIKEAIRAYSAIPDTVLSAARNNTGAIVRAFLFRSKEWIFDAVSLTYRPI